MRPYPMTIFGQPVRSFCDHRNQPVNPAEINAAAWRKSSWSNYAGNCVEIAGLPGDRVGIRDTKDRGTGPVLLFTRAEWTAFLSRTKDGKFDSI